MCTDDQSSEMKGEEMAPRKETIPTASAADKKPNIIFIMGDDIGWFNIGAYH